MATLKVGGTTVNSTQAKNIRDGIDVVKRVNHTHSVYVSKQGVGYDPLAPLLNGLNPSESIDSIGDAMEVATELMSSAISATGVRVVVLDGGTYTENITVPSSVYLDAKAATLVGTIDITGGSEVFLDKHFASADNQNMVTMGSATAGPAIYQANICDGGGFEGVNNVRNSGGSGRNLFVRVGVMYVGIDGVGIGYVTSGVGHIHVSIEDLYLAGDNAIGILGSNQGVNASNILGMIHHILEINSPATTVGISVTHASAIIKLIVAEIIAGTAYDVAAGDLYLVCPKITGTQTGSTKFQVGNGGISFTGTGAVDTLTNLGAAASADVAAKLNKDLSDLTPTEAAYIKTEIAGDCLTALIDDPTPTAGGMLDMHGNAIGQASILQLVSETPGGTVPDPIASDSIETYLHAKYVGNECIPYASSSLNNRKPLLNTPNIFYEDENWINHSLPIGSNTWPWQAPITGSTNYVVTYNNPPNITDAFAELQLYPANPATAGVAVTLRKHAQTVSSFEIPAGINIGIRYDLFVKVTNVSLGDSYSIFAGLAENASNASFSDPTAFSSYVGLLCSNASPVWQFTAKAGGTVVTVDVGPGPLYPSTEMMFSIIRLRNSNTWYLYADSALVATISTVTIAERMQRVFNFTRTAIGGSRNTVFSCSFCALTLTK